MQQKGCKREEWKCGNDPSQSPDLKLTEMLWRDLERAVHKRMHRNLNEVKHSCKEEWAKIPLQQCVRLIKSERK